MSGLPRHSSMSTYQKVRARVAMKKVMAARNLPSTTSQSRTGEVSSSSMVPIFCSSASSRMVSTGASQGRMKMEICVSVSLMLASGKLAPVRMESTLRTKK